VLSTKEGIDRAFKKLEELSPNVAVWWRSGAQQSQLMKDGEVDMTTGWNGRIQAAIDDGAPAAISFEGGVVQNDCYAIPKGAPNRDRAMKILGALTSPQVQANLAKRLPYGPTNKRAFEADPAGGRRRPADEPRQARPARSSSTTPGTRPTWRPCRSASTGCARSSVPDGHAGAKGKGVADPHRPGQQVVRLGPALDDVSLEIASGEFLTLLGPSGSGKTTLLMVLAGFVRADQGSLTFDGREMILAPPHRRGVGMVFQNYALFPHMTVAGNIGYPLRLRRVTKADTAARVAEALRTVRLEAYGERRVHELSGGQRQRVRARSRHRLRARHPPNGRAPLGAG
jgi:ABC-type multidrug transport system fused ATPase/permease subunit